MRDICITEETPKSHIAKGRRLASAVRSWGDAEKRNCCHGQLLIRFEAGRPKIISNIISDAPNESVPECVQSKAADAMVLACGDQQGIYIELSYGYDCVRG